MGISDPFEDLYQLKIYLKQAQAALRLGALVYQDSQISFYERCKPYHMFEHFETNELLRFCHHLVLKLKHYDEKNDTSYVETLRAALNSQLSICTSQYHQLPHSEDQGDHGSRSGSI